MSGGLDAGLEAHLQSGHTTLCHAWRIVRSDGVRLAFTDHDLPLVIDGETFRADTGLSARALAQTTGLAVDNTEALGALSDVTLREDEIEQGRFDGAEVEAWLVNWADTSQRQMQFRGTIGELRRIDGAFRAELRGLTEALNRPQGRLYQKPCTAVLGDAGCGFDTDAAGYAETRAIEDVVAAQEFVWNAFGGFGEGWFTRGRLEVIDGPGAGLWAMVKHDRFEGTRRRVTLWTPIRAELAPGTRIKLVAGCDKRLDTCRLKFNNILNYQGFPDVPGEDWVMAVPRSTGTNTGGSRR